MCYPRIRGNGNAYFDSRANKAAGNSAGAGVDHIYKCFLGLSSPSFTGTADAKTCEIYSSWYSTSFNE
jgi:hypothetical protein